MSALHDQRETRSLQVPALAPCASYVSRLSARSALYTELRLLLGGRARALSTEEYRSCVLDDNFGAELKSRVRLGLTVVVR